MPLNRHLHDRVTDMDLGTNRQTGLIVRVGLTNGRILLRFTMILSIRYAYALRPLSEGIAINKGVHVSCIRSVTLQLVLG